MAFKEGLERGGGGKAAAAGLALLFAAVAALSLLDSAYLHPGYSDWDEYGNLSLLQFHREGVPLVWSFARGCWHRLACALSLDALGPGLTAARLPALLGLAVQAFATGALAQRLFGGRAFFWAGAAVLASANALLRGRSVLAFSLWPAELALMLVLQTALDRGWKALLWGLAAALLLLDYEGWAVSLPVLALAWTTVCPRPALWRWALPGFALGAAVVAAVSAPNLASWWATRRMMTVPPAQGGWLLGQAGRSLHMLFFGAPTLIFLGVPGHPAVPPWTWPLVLAGLAFAGLRRAAWLAAGMAVCLLPALLHFTEAEPQRLLGFSALTPLLAGAGAAWAWARWGRTAGWALAALLALGLGMEVDALQRGMAVEYGRGAAFGWHQEMGVRALARRLEGAKVRLVTELGFEGGAPLRLLAGSRGLALAGDAPNAVAALPWELVHAARRDPRLKRLEWMELGERSDAPKSTYLFCDGAARARLEAVEAVLLPLRRETLNQSPRQAWRRYRAALDALPAAADPWLRSVLIECWVDKALYVGELAPEEAGWVLAQDLLSGAVCHRMSQSYSALQPELALRCALKAVSVDPSQVKYFIAAAQQAARLRRGPELARLRREFERWHPGLLLHVGQEEVEAARRRG